MKNKVFVSLISTLFVCLLVACTSTDPLGIECDIEAIELNVADYSQLFYNESETKQDVGYDYNISKTIAFSAKSDAVVGSYDTRLTISAGAKAFWRKSGSEEVAFEPIEGQPNVVHCIVDYSDQQVQTLVVYPEDGSKSWSREYRVQICLMQEDNSDTETSARVLTFLYEFNEGSYHLFGKNPNKNNYYVWEETEDSLKALFRMGDYTWKNGNPGFKIANSSLSPMEYPTVPVFGGGPDGSDCIKLETKSAGKMGEEVGCPTAAGSMFLGTFTAEKALASKEEAVKATLFGTPFTHIPTQLEVDLKLVQVGTAQLADGTSFTDEPDVYCVIYDNDGGTFVLDGGNVLTDRQHIKAIARLPHLYDGINDKVTVNPVHGLVPGGDWQHVTLPLDYDPFDKSSIDSTSETRLKVIDQELLKTRGYSIAIGASSSWQGGDFHAFIGQTILLDNLKLTCIDPSTGTPEEPDDPEQPVEQPKDSQCKLSKIMIGNTSLFENAGEAVQVASDAEVYTFHVKWDADLHQVPVSFEYSEKATMYFNQQPFANGTAVDFSEGKQSFELVSEDEANRRTVTIQFERLPKPISTLSMLFNNNYALNSTGKFYEWGETESSLKQYLFDTTKTWGTTNYGFSLFRNGQAATAYPAVPVGGGYEGNCVRLKTLSNGTMGTMLNKRFTAGMLFLGAEGTVATPQSVTSENLKMGVPFKAKALSVSAYLKYVPGTGYQDENGNSISVMTDEPDFYCVVYKNTGNVSLSASDVFTNQNIVGMGRLSHPIHGVGNAWTKVTLDIKYKDPNMKASDFAKGDYSLIICACSSYDAVHNRGALNSELYVDDIVLEYE